MLNIGVIGYGYWGPNIVRNFMGTDGACVSAVCDIEHADLKRAQKLYPHVRLCSDYSEVVSSPGIDAVAIVTPVFTHYKIAKEALLNGKHVFIEKPFTYKVEEAEELIRLAKKNGLKIMVDHTFLFTGAVRKIKELIDKDMLGDLYYYDSTRVNLGLFQHDVNVIWDLAPHDLAIMDYVIKEKPVCVSSHGMSHFKRGLEDVAYLTLYFKNNMIAHFNVNWLSPVKIRMTCIGGTKKMLVWNDLESDEKLRLYDKGVRVKSREGAYKLLVDYRSGDMWGPKIDYTEALKLEAGYFIECIEKDKDPINGGYSGLEVVRMLNAADRSLKSGGRKIKI